MTYYVKPLFNLSFDMSQDKRDNKIKKGREEERKKGRKEERKKERKKGRKEERKEGRNFIYENEAQLQCRGIVKSSHRGIAC